MQNFMHIATNAGHTRQNDGRSMQNDGQQRVMLAATHLMALKGSQFVTSKVTMLKLTF